MKCPAEIARQSCRTGWLTLLLLASLITNLSGCSPPVTLPQPTPATIQKASSTAAEKHLQDVCHLIVRRLDLMPGVAQAKWNRQLPITDEKREQVLLTKLAAEGEAMHLPSKFVADFFRAQITAAKQIQEESFREWTAQQHAPFDNPPDLDKEVRPQIDEINKQMLEGLAKCWHERSAPDWATALDRAQRAVFSSNGWSQDVIATATKPLRDIAAAGK